MKYISSSFSEQTLYIEHIYFEWYNLEGIYKFKNIFQNVFFGIIEASFPKYI